jgi:hypothetical protein
LYNQYLQTVFINNRKGVITNIDIPSDIPICEFNGTIYTDEQLKTMSDIVDDVLQIGPNTFIGPSGNVTDHIRHSCNPNCIIKIAGYRAILYSLYVIKANSEISFDYSTSSTDDHNTWKLNCTCGSFNCRKIISGFYTLPVELQKEYKDKNIAAPFIKTPIFLKK